MVWAWILNPCALGSRVVIFIFSSLLYTVGKLSSPAAGCHRCFSRGEYNDWRIERGGWLQVWFPRLFSFQNIAGGTTGKCRRNWVPLVLGQNTGRKTY